MASELWKTNGSFEFNGHDMYAEFGLRILECNYDRVAPTLRQRATVVPQRSGSFDFGAKYYDDRKITLLCASLNEQSRDYWRELSFILAHKGKLYIYSESDKYYVGRIYDPSEIERIRDLGASFTLTFLCEPFAYGVTKTESFTLDNNIPTYIPNYPGTASTPTYIVITNSGDTTVVAPRIVQLNRRENY